MKLIFYEVYFFANCGSFRNQRYRTFACEHCFHKKKSSEISYGDRGRHKMGPVFPIQ